MKNTTKIVSDGLDGYRVYPTIGNHDTYPQDIIKMASPRDNAAIQEWSPEWLQWIPDEEQQKNFLDWGYYSLDLTGINGEKLGNKKTKVISLNTNICYRFNWETLTNFDDPGNMLDWLSDELSALEAVDGTAIIIAHVPNIDECTRQFGRRYHALMDRYQTVIRWGMYSHVHQEQYQVARDVYERKAIGMNFIVGSATTYMGKPPSFNVIYLDPDTMLPVDYETIAFDLNHANEFDEPIWNKVYDYR